MKGNSVDQPVGSAGRKSDRRLDAAQCAAPRDRIFYWQTGPKNPVAAHNELMGWMPPSAGIV